MGNVFNDEFCDADDVFGNFNVNDSDRVGVNIIFASYTYEAYEGFAVVIFERGGKLYEVYGSHCSCYGLEDQWEPEEIDIDIYGDVLNKRGDSKILEAFTKYLESR